MEIEEKLDSMIKGYEKQNRGLDCLVSLPIVINDLKELKQSLPPKQEITEFPEHIVKYLENCKARNVAIEVVLNDARYYNRDYAYWTEEEIRKIAVAYATSKYTVKKEPNIHHLKIGLTYFKAVREGRKTFEIRKNDRDYKVGDILVLQEYTCGSYTDEQCEVKVTYMTDYEQKDDYVVLGIVPVEGEAE